MKSKCRFFVTKVADLAYLCENGSRKNAQEVIMTAAQGQGKQPEPNFGSAPSGSLIVTITNEALVGAFKPATEYFLTLEPVPVPGKTS